MEFFKKIKIIDPKIRLILLIPVLIIPLFFLNPIHKNKANPARQIPKIRTHPTSFLITDIPIRNTIIPSTKFNPTIVKIKPSVTPEKDQTKNEKIPDSETESKNNLIAATPTQTINPTATGVPEISQKVNLEIKTQNNTINFSVEIKEGMNVCEILQKAKDNGNISSLIFNDSFMSTFHSLFVTEINGESGNWVFTVNGTSPLGCSLSQPSANDNIVWKTV